ncbi:MAG: erythromycin esterase family protein [Planctomycetes bacterium]|nr:erythromycin esterase family protein [Planctomycetota bacterium]
MYRIAAVALLFVILQSGNSPNAVASNPASNPYLRPESLPESMPAASRAALIEDLRQRAHSLKSIDPDDENMDDLKPIGEAVKDAKIVLLGELHYEANCYLIKSRIIKYLHKYCGFDVLAFEANMFTGIELGKKIEKGCAVDEISNADTFEGPWHSATDISPLWTYILNTQKQKNPLRFCGMDVKFNCFNHEESQGLAHIREVLDKSGASPLTDEEWKFSHDVFQGRVENEQRKLPAFQRIYSLNKKISDELRARESIIAREIGAREFALLTQLAGNMDPFVKWWYSMGDWNPIGSFGHFTNPRDAAMAENTRWLQRVYYPNSKIIVWAGGAHCGCDSKDWTEDGTPEQLNIWSGLVSLGQGLRNQCGDGVFIIGIGPRRGKIGHDNFITPLRPSDGDSIENLIGEAGLQCAFLNLRALPADHWLRKYSINSNAINPRPIRSLLPATFDGYIYLDEASPANYDRPETPEEPASRKK